MSNKKKVNIVNLVNRKKGRIASVQSWSLKLNKSIDEFKLEPKLELELELKLESCFFFSIRIGEKCISANV